MDYRIFSVRTGVIVCDCTRGCTDTVREFALKLYFGGKIPFRTGESNLRKRRVSPLYKLSQIPALLTFPSPPPPSLTLPLPVSVPSLLPTKVKSQNVTLFLSSSEPRYFSSCFFTRVNILLWNSEGNKTI